MSGENTVADQMRRTPRVLGAEATAGELRTALGDAHTNCGLIVDEGRLVAVVVSDDLAGASDDALGAEVGTLEGRTVSPTDAAEAWRVRMAAQGIRRLAVVDDGGMLLGLLCLQEGGEGFCRPAEAS